MRFLGGKTTDEVLRRRFDRLTSQYERGYGHWGTFEKETGRLLGAVGLLNHDDWTETPYTVEVGWLIRSDAWNRGYATEAARASLAYAFDVLGHERIICIVDPRNAPSRRVAEKIGLDLAGETVWRDYDCVWYEGGRT